MAKSLVVAALRAEIRTNEALKKNFEKEYTSASEVTKMFNCLDQICSAQWNQRRKGLIVTPIALVLRTH